MTGKVIIFHLPVYILALLGAIMLFLLAIAPDGERISVNIPDGELQYTALDSSITLGKLVSELNAISSEQLSGVNGQINRDEMPRQISYWIYISPAKDTKPNLIFADFIYRCPICPRDDVFDMYRLNFVLDDLRGLVPRSHFWRESIVLSNYLVPAQGPEKTIRMASQIWNSNN